VTSPGKVAAPIAKESHAHRMWRIRLSGLVAAATTAGIGTS
jgi:hypothetical protein